MASARISSEKSRTQQNAPLLTEPPYLVTIVDPAHPLFGQTLPIVRPTSPRGRAQLVVLLLNGHHRSIARSATDLDSPVPTRPVHQGLSPISVRTMLPVAQFIRAKLAATEEMSHDLPTCPAQPAASVPRPPPEREPQSLAPRALEPAAKIWPKKGEF